MSIDAETLSIADLAERWAVDSSTIRRRRLKGELPEPVTKGRKRGLRWSRKSIEAFEAVGFSSPKMFREKVGRVAVAGRSAELRENEAVRKSYLGY